LAEDQGEAGVRPYADATVPGGNQVLRWRAIQAERDLEPVMHFEQRGNGA